MGGKKNGAGTPMKNTHSTPKSLSTFTTEPKTRRHLKGAGIKEKRSCGFMQYLFDGGFRTTVNYDLLLSEAWDYFGTDDYRTITGYIGRPQTIKKSIEKTINVTIPAKCASYTKVLQESITMQRRIGYLEKRGYIELSSEFKNFKLTTTVLLFHESVPLPYHTVDVAFPPAPPPREVLRKVVRVDDDVTSSIDDLCVSPISTAQDVGDKQGDYRETTTRDREERE